MSTGQTKPVLEKRRLHLPSNIEALRTLRHDLRTPINPILGYCELIVEEAGASAPMPLLAGLRQLHAAGTRMLLLTNEIFSDKPSALRGLDCSELQREFRAPAEAVAALCLELEQQATDAALPVAARDLRRIGIAASRWLVRIEEMLAQNCR
ncbi:MAG: histidine kinase dimerization/phospho-acceptor domain-containing protein [Limisphaerales bacterium]